MLRGDEQLLRAELYRDGLVIAFLAVRPLRLKNMMGLEIGTNFLLTAIGYLVDLAAEETKTHASPALPMPVRLAPFIRRYLKLASAAPGGGTAGRGGRPDGPASVALTGTQRPAAACQQLRGHDRQTNNQATRCPANPASLPPLRRHHPRRGQPEDFHIIRIILSTRPAPPRRNTLSRPITSGPSTRPEQYHRAERSSYTKGRRI